MKIYAISGLGADKRVFDQLSLKLPLIAIEWITPLEKESISDYSQRLSQQINPKEKFIIMGVSFGGLIAVELSKKLSPEKTILISTVETRDELRIVYRMFGKLNILPLIPTSLFKIPKWLAKLLFNAKNKTVLYSIIDDTDNYFTKWATNRLVNWKNRTPIKNSIKISGTSDKLMPPRNDNRAILIKGGGHFMIYDKAEEISKILNKLL